MNEQIDQAIATFQSAIILAEGNYHRGSATFDKTLEIESAAVAKLKAVLHDLKIMTTPHNSDTELEQLKEMVYNHLSEVAQIGDNPITDNHINDLVALIKQRETRLIREAQIDEIRKFREAMINHWTPATYEYARLKDIKYQSTLKQESEDSHAK